MRNTKHRLQILRSIHLEIFVWVSLKATFKNRIISVAMPQTVCLLAECMYPNRDSYSNSKSHYYQHVESLTSKFVILKHKSWFKSRNVRNGNDDREKRNKRKTFHWTAMKIKITAILSTHSRMTKTNNFFIGPNKHTPVRTPKQQNDKTQYSVLRCAAVPFKSSSTKEEAKIKTTSVTVACCMTRGRTYQVIQHKIVVIMV